jgi:hypothetical protein
MKRRSILAGLALAAWLATAPGTVFAQFTVTITVDENGHGSLANSSGFMAPLPFAQQQDPGPGGMAGAATYGLLGPPGLTGGDVLLVEPGVNGTLSDLIRFNPNQNGGSLVFYSDQPQDALADIGFPTALNTNTASFVEVGPEGANGFSYTPTSGMPGFISGAGGPVTYVLQSDVQTVPEPASIVMGGISLSVGLVIACVRRKRGTSSRKQLAAR